MTWRAFSGLIGLRSIAPSRVRYNLSDWGSEHLDSNVIGFTMHGRGNQLTRSDIFGNPALI
jgi:hypothetical protein